MSSFSDPKIISLLQEQFIPAVGNDWYNRRREDATGTFFRNVADQGPRKGEGGSTRQGHYIFTASGKLLGYNNNRSAERRTAFIHDALDKWQQLPASEREPRALDLAEEEPDLRFAASPPEGGLVLRTFTRALKPDGENPARLVACADEDVDHPGGHFSAFDHVWVKAAEWQALRKVAESGGGAVPRALALRILRFHLVDNTRGEPPFWKRDEVRDYTLEIQPTDISGKYLITGMADLETEDGKRGFNAQLRGTLETGAGGRATRFDLVALGNHWGQGPYTLQARPGKSPLGVAFELAARDRPSDEVRPQASHDLKSYWEADQ